MQHKLDSKPNVETFRTLFVLDNKKLVKSFKIIKN